MGDDEEDEDHVSTSISSLQDIIDEARARVNISTQDEDPFEEVFRRWKAQEAKFKAFEDSLYMETKEAKLNWLNVGGLREKNEIHPFVQTDSLPLHSGVLEKAKALLDTCERRTKFYPSGVERAAEEEDKADEMFVGADEGLSDISRERRKLIEEFKSNDLVKRIEKEACRQDRNEGVAKQLALIEEQQKSLQRQIEIEQLRKLEEIEKEGARALQLIEEQCAIERRNLLENPYAPKSRILLDGQSTQGKAIAEKDHGFVNAITDAMVSCESSEEKKPNDNHTGWTAIAKVDESKIDILRNESAPQGQRKQPKKPNNNKPHACKGFTREREEDCLKTLAPAGEAVDTALLITKESNYLGTSRNNLCSLFKGCIKNIEKCGMKSAISEFPIGIQKAVENMHRVLVGQVNFGYDFGDLLCWKLLPRYDFGAHREHKLSRVQRRVARLIAKVLKLSMNMVGSSMPLTHEWKGLEHEAKQIGVQLALMHHARRPMSDNIGATSISIEGSVVAAFQIDGRGRLIGNLDDKYRSQENSEMIEGCLNQSEEVQMDRVKRSWKSFMTKKNFCLKHLQDEKSPTEPAAFNSFTLVSLNDAGRELESQSPNTGKSSGLMCRQEEVEESSVHMGCSVINDSSIRNNSDMEFQAINTETDPGLIGWQEKAEEFQAPKPSGLLCWQEKAEEYQSPKPSGLICWQEECIVDNGKGSFVQRDSREEVELQAADREEISGLTCWQEECIADNGKEVEFQAADREEISGLICWQEECIVDNGKDSFVQRDSKEEVELQAADREEISGLICWQEEAEESSSQIECSVPHNVELIGKFNISKVPGNRDALMATKIQALVRGHFCRLLYRQLQTRQEEKRKAHERLELDCLLRIQAFWRGLYVRRLRLIESLRVDKRLQNNLATKIQALWRGFIVRMKFKKALARSKYIDDDDFDYAAIDSVLFTMTETATYDQDMQDEANLVSHPEDRTRQEHPVLESWQGKANSVTETTTPSDEDLYIMEEQAPSASPSHRPSFVNQDLNDTLQLANDTTTAPLEKLDPGSPSNRREIEQKRKEYISSIAKDWGFKNERTVKQFLKACSKKRPSTTNLPPQDSHKHRSLSKK